MLSISRPAWETLTRPAVSVRIHARFRRALNLVVSRENDGTDTSSEAQIITLVTPELGNGPFHLVVDRLPPDLPEAAKVRRKGDDLEVGSWALHMGAACRLWNPRPSWETLAVADDKFRGLQTWIEHAARVRDLPSSVESLLAALPPLTHDLCSALLCSALHTGDRRDLRAAAAALAGLGPGLTPSGDDVLAGVMLSLWAAHHPERVALGSDIATAAAPRTTRLSRAFLRAAAAGLADEKWHRLFEALATTSSTNADPGAVRQAVDRIIAYGATSGLDMLQGFSQGYQAVRRIT